MSTTMNYSQHLGPRSVLLGLQATDAHGLLNELVEGLVDSNPELAPRRAELLAALKERESQGSTASQGVAIPHVKLPGLSQVTMVLGVHRLGVNFRALDSEPVHVFFSIVRPLETADQHLELLRWCASIAQHEDFVSFTRQTQSVQEVLSLLNELAPA